MSSRPLIGQDELQSRVLKALFDYIQDDSERLSPEDVARLLGDEFSEARVQMALRALENAELAHGSHGMYGSSYEISEAGYRAIESDTIKTRLEPRNEPVSAQALSGDPIVDWLPASDRLVPINHNSAEYLEVKSRIDEVREIVRTANDLNVSVEARNDLLRSLDSAKTLWESTQLTLFQLKIGILLAAQQSWSALKKHSQAIAAALLVDAVKAFIKSHTGIDLDAL